MNNNKIFKCCICGKEERGWGNNPWGAEIKDEQGKLKEFKETDKCCDECNSKFVIPGRITRFIEEELPDLLIACRNNKWKRGFIK